MKLFSACLIVVLCVCLSFTSIVLARSDYHFEEVSQAQINEALGKTVPIRFLPSSPFYFLISAKEKISRFFKPSSLYKTEFDFALSGKRLKEAYLLFEKNDIKNASFSLNKYSEVVNRMIKQLDKAKSQNQDIVSLVSRIYDQLSYQDKLLVAVWQKSQAGIINYSFDKNLEESIQSFEREVLAVDSIKPGIKNRFIIPRNIKEASDSQPVASPSPTFVPIIDSTSSTIPKRIIY